MNDAKQTILITGAARRIGAAIAVKLHTAGFDLALHYRESIDDVQRLADDLNKIRANSVSLYCADLTQFNQIEEFTRKVGEQVSNLSAVINNASLFFPTSIGQTTEADWDQLHSVNLKAPYFVVQGLVDVLRKNHGCVINITDIYADRPLSKHAAYAASKAGLTSLTKSMASELAPEVRVNAIAPGAILWPENGSENENILQKIPMNRSGDPEDIASAVLFLIQDAPYINGQTITIDGGRSVVA
jgi:pteridine reductase